MNKYLCFLLLLLPGVWLGATAQEADVLSYAGKEYAIFSNPLEVYLEKNSGKQLTREVYSSSNWWGYVAYWEIADGQLLLSDIRLETADQEGSSEPGSNVKTKSALKQIFPQGGKILASWFSGYIVIPEGEMRTYVHIGYGSLFEKNTIFKIISGALAETKNLSAEQFQEFRDAQFAAFKKTREYQQSYANFKKNREEQKLDVATLESFLYEYYSGKYLSMIFADVKQ